MWEAFAKNILLRFLYLIFSFKNLLANNQSFKFSIGVWSVLDSSNKTIGILVYSVYTAKWPWTNHPMT